MSEVTNLACVKCTSILDRAIFEGLEVDLCPSCGGLWLDRGEVTRAARLPAVEIDRLRALLTEVEEPPTTTAGSASASQGAVIPCPACTGSLTEVLLGSVRVDYCSGCQGIFLDRGELDGALAAVRARDASATASQIFAAAVSIAR